MFADENPENREEQCGFRYAGYGRRTQDRRCPGNNLGYKFSDHGLA